MKPIRFTNIKGGEALIGIDSSNRTIERFDLGGCDLGYPVYDRINDRLYILFGDSFNQANFLESDKELNWRSQTMGIIESFKKNKDFRFDRFYERKDEHGASSLLLSHHENNLEMTKIPTGGLFVNGSLYFFYFDICSWDIESSQMMNYCGLAKYVPGSGFVRVPNMTWINPDATSALKKVLDEDENLVEVSSLDIETHHNPMFTEVYPKDFGDEFIYLYGQGSYRMTGVYLARIRKVSFEDFSTLEYFVGLKNGEPQFEKAPSALMHLAPVLKDFCGEFSLVHLTDKKTYFLFGTRQLAGSDKLKAIREVVCYSSPSFFGPFISPEVLVKVDDPFLKGCNAYAPLTDESFYDPVSSRLSLILSRWLPSYCPITLSIKLED